MTNHTPLSLSQVNYALELIKELHPIAKTPLYQVYPTLRPLRNMLSFMPWMRYEELGDDGEHEMNDLLDSSVQRTVEINGRSIIKKNLAQKFKSMVSD